jgi:hypothetical protein
MKKQEQLAAFDELTNKAFKIMISKGADYANEDALSNFKNAASIVGISPEQQCLSLIAVKVARLGNLFKGVEPNNESIQDSIIDLYNYTALLYMIETEK